LFRADAGHRIACMSPRQDRPGKGAERRFFVAVRPDEAVPVGARVHLADTDADHARTVLRLAVGDRCIGLDGAGRSWPMLVTRVDRKGVEVEAAAVQTFVPAPGEEDAPLPWIELAVALPRASQADEMVDALAQLGAAVLTPLTTERTTSTARADAEGRRARFERIARESSKQSGRLWNLHIGQSHDLESLAARGPAAWAHCDPRASHPLGAALTTPTGFTRVRPLVIAVGPEGGFTPAEDEWLAARAAVSLSLGPHVLRTETAAVAALAIVVAAVTRR